MWWVDKLCVLVPCLFVLEQEVIYADEHHCLVALTEVNLRPFYLIDAVYIILWTELAYYDVRIVNLSANYLAVPVDARHNIVSGVHVRA